MPAISPALSSQLRKTLLSCGPFDSHQQLLAVFVDQRIAPWRTIIPSGDSQKTRVDLTIAALVDRYNVSRENALVLLLRVLAEQVEPADSCYSALNDVADRLEQELRSAGDVHEQSTDTTLDDVRQYQIGLARLRSQIEVERPDLVETIQALESRLRATAERVQTSGDTEANRSARARLLAELDRLAQSVAGTSFLEYLQAAGESPVVSPEVAPELVEARAAIAEAAASGRRELDLARRQLRQLPSEIGQLTQLERLDLSNNRLTELPSELNRLTSLKRLDLRNNPFLPIPPEIVAKVEEPAAILRYYARSRAEAQAEQRQLNEVKMILVGEGGVGKTSLVRRLVDGSFDEREEKTPGIAVTRWHFELGDRNICANIWDFGGQEIMHATHQFFLTRRSLYVLVIDARKGEQESNLDYWLKLIQSFGEESPIIVVVNKVDEHPLDLNRRGLQEKYKTIRAFVNTSCRSGAGIDELRQTIEREIDLLPDIRTLWLRRWFAVKQRLEQLDRDYIPYEEYIRICREESITSQTDQRLLIGFLHDLGVVLSYRDDPRLEETNVLNPDWVTHAIYAILNNHALFQSKGVLRRAGLDTILDPERYPSWKHGFILGIMQKFELCFSLEDAAGESYLLPDLLPKEEPFLRWPRLEETLLFQYRYQVLPSSIMSRFIVRMNMYIAQGTSWRTGVVLVHQGVEALIKADLPERILSVSLTGDARHRREFLAVIRSTLDQIHRTVPRIEAQAWVPIATHPHIAVEYQHLLTLEKLGQEMFVPPGLTELKRVKELLDGVELRGADVVPTANGTNAGQAEPSTIVQAPETTPRVSAQPEFDTAQLPELRRVLDRYFSLSELRALAFDLQIDIEDLGGSTKGEMAINLIAHLQRRDRLQELVTMVRQHRPLAGI